MNTPTLHLDHAMIRKILPHTGPALILDTAEIKSPTEAKGYFMVLADDPRIANHFYVMPGVLIAEFCHLTGAVLLMHDAKKAIIPVLNETKISVSEAVFPGEDLECEVRLASQLERTFSFEASVCKAHSKRHVATVLFTGTRIPRPVFERQRRYRG